MIIRFAAIFGGLLGLIFYRPVLDDNRLTPAKIPLESGCSTTAGFHEMDRYPARAAMIDVKH